MGAPALDQRAARKDGDTTAASQDQQVSSGKESKAARWADESQDADHPLFFTNEFRIYAYKVLPCSKRYCHDWTQCPFAHPSEKARRRDVRIYSYTPVACPDLKKNGVCPRGDACSYSHNIFEQYLHPSRYRTQLCNDGAHCRRKVCFFAHTVEELRTPNEAGMLPVSADTYGMLGGMEGGDSTASPMIAAHPGGAMPPLMPTFPGLLGGMEGWEGASGSSGSLSPLAGMSMGPPPALQTSFMEGAPGAPSNLNGCGAPGALPRQVPCSPMPAAAVSMAQASSQLASAQRMEALVAQLANMQTQDAGSAAGNGALVDALLQEVRNNVGTAANNMAAAIVEQQVQSAMEQAAALNAAAAVSPGPPGLGGISAPAFTAATAAMMDQQAQQRGALGALLSPNLSTISPAAARMVERTPRASLVRMQSLSGQLSQPLEGANSVLGPNGRDIRRCLSVDINAALAGSSSAGNLASSSFAAGAGANLQAMMSAGLATAPAGLRGGGAFDYLSAPPASAPSGHGMSMPCQPAFNNSSLLAMIAAAQNGGTDEGRLPHSAGSPMQQADDSRTLLSAALMSDVPVSGANASSSAAMLSAAAAAASNPMSYGGYFG